MIVCGVHVLMVYVHVLLIYNIAGAYQEDEYSGEIFLLSKHTFSKLIVVKKAGCTFLLNH